MKLSKKQEEQLGWIAENCNDPHARNNNNDCAYCECATMAGCKPYSARTLLSLRKHGLIQIWDVKREPWVNGGLAWVQLTEENCRHLEGNGVYFCRTTPKYDELTPKQKGLDNLAHALETLAREEKKPTWEERHQGLVNASPMDSLDHGWALNHGPELIEQLRHARDCEFKDQDNCIDTVLYNLIDYAIDYIQATEDKKKNILFVLAESLGSPFDALYKQQQERKKANV